MQHMMNNPQLMEQMLRNSPLLAGNPQAAEMVGVAIIITTASGVYKLTIFFPNSVSFRQEMLLRW